MERRSRAPSPVQKRQRSDHVCRWEAQTHDEHWAAYPDDVNDRIEDAQRLGQNPVEVRMKSPCGSRDFTYHIGTERMVHNNTMTQRERSIRCVASGQWNAGEESAEQWNEKGGVWYWKGGVWYWGPPKVPSNSAAPEGNSASKRDSSAQNEEVVIYESGRGCLSREKRLGTIVSPLYQVSGGYCGVFCEVCLRILQEERAVKAVALGSVPWEKPIARTGASHTSRGEPQERASSEAAPRTSQLKVQAILSDEELSSMYGRGSHLLNKMGYAGSGHALHPERPDSLQTPLQAHNQGRSRKRVTASDDGGSRMTRRESNSSGAAVGADADATPRGSSSAPLAPSGGPMIYLTSSSGGLLSLRCEGREGAEPLLQQSVHACGLSFPGDPGSQAGFCVR